MWFRKKLRPSISRRGFFLRKSEEISKLTSLKRHRFTTFPSLHRFWRASKTVIIIIGGITITASLAYFIFFSSFVHVKKIVYTPNSPIFAPIIATLVGKNLFFIPFTPLKLKILESYPNEIQSVTLKRKFPGTLAVSFEAYPAVSNTIVRLPNVQKKFTINAKGLIIQEDSENPELPYITFETDELPKLKSLVLPEDFLMKMVKAENLFTDKFGMKVNEVRYKKREREAHLLTERNFIIMLDLTQDIEIQLFKLKRALGAINIFQDNLEYIDLRISGQTGDKVLFRRRSRLP